MALIDPVLVLPAAAVGSVHFIAIGGAGMSGIARLYAELGIHVSGSDQADSPVLADLAAHGIRTHVGHDPAQLGDAETVVVSTAIQPDNVELVEARRRGLRVWHRSTALAALMVGKRGVAISGTHGKTTTSGMVATVLAGCGQDPSYVIGAPLASNGLSSHLGSGQAFVVEADESDGSFRQYPAELVVITNVEADHLDNWETAQKYAAGFAEVVAAPRVHTVVLSADDPGTVELAVHARAAGKNVVTFGTREDADVRITDVRLIALGSGCTLIGPEDVGSLNLRVPGLYNIRNAAAAYAVGRAFGLAGADVRAQLELFAGTARRFQLVGESAGVRVYDDYAHHPTEVAATLVAARGAVGAGRVVACFQPHLFTRTRDFAAEFGRALSIADLVVITDVYPSREDPIPGVTGEMLVPSVTSEVHYVPDKHDLASELAGLVRAGDLVILVGAGDINRVGPLLVQELSRREFDN